MTKRQVFYNCETCGKECKEGARHYDVKKHHFCSRKCYGIHRTEHKAEYYKTTYKQNRLSSNRDAYVRCFSHLKGWPKRFYEIYGKEPTTNELEQFKSSWSVLRHRDSAVLDGE